MSDLTVIVIVQVVTFLALVLLMRRIMYSAYARELNRLRSLSLEHQKRAEKLAEELERAEKEQQEKIAKAEAKLRQEREQLRKEADERREEVLRKAREEGDKIVKQAMNVKDRIRRELENQMDERCVDLGCSLIQNLMTEGDMRWFHDGLVKDVLAAVQNISADRVRGVDAKSKAVARTPYPLKDDELQSLTRTLSEKAGEEISLKQETDPDVIAGIAIQLGNLIIDGSLAGKLREEAKAKQTA